IMRKKVREIVPPDQAASAVKFVEKMFREGSGYIEGTSLTKAGRHVPVEIWVRRIDYLGQPALLFQVSDISLRRELEQKLLQSQKMEAVGRLVGGVAHDFNNLLTVIIGNTQFGLLDAPASSPLRNDLRKIEEAAMQARDLVSQLLTFSRNQIMEPKQLCLNQIVSNHINMLRRIIGEQIRIETRLDSKLWPIRGDPAQLQQLLMNLSVNAKDAMPEGGKLTIRTRNYMTDERLSLDELQLRHQAEPHNPVRFVELVVQDTGMGIEKASLSRLFDPFFTTKDVGKGTGLGLAVVYGIVNQHGGFIKVDSEVGKGTCFKIYFPTVGEGELSEKVTEIDEPVPRGNETILVVEDDRTVLNVARRILTNLGYRVFTASDGEQALKILQEKQDEVEALVLDVVMPGWSGPKTYQQMTQIRPDLAVIFVTGYDVKAEMEHLDIEENPKTALLQKPYTQESLAKKVRAVLDAP
ncbi:MAG: response regulator, partial [Calditrichaeota bacterium]